MNTVREIERLNERELQEGISLEGSWHWRYNGSAWVYVGGLPFHLSEGDIICVFSQFGEIEDIHLVRDEETGKSRGFAFVKYEDWRSTVLAVDNMNGVQLLGRVLRVDHKPDYQPPQKKKKDRTEEEEMEIKTHVPGHAYEGKELKGEYTIQKGVDLFAAPPSSPSSIEETVQSKDHRRRRRDSHTSSHDRHKESHKGDRHRDSHKRDRHRDSHKGDGHKDSHKSDRHEDSHKGDRHRDSHKSGRHRHSHKSDRHKESHTGDSHRDGHKRDRHHSSRSEDIHIRTRSNERKDRADRSETGRKIESRNTTQDPSSSRSLSKDHRHTLPHSSTGDVGETVPDKAELNHDRSFKSNQRGSSRSRSPMRSSRFSRTRSVSSTRDHSPRHSSSRMKARSSKDSRSRSPSRSKHLNASSSSHHHHHHHPRDESRSRSRRKHHHDRNNSRSRSPRNYRNHDKKRSRVSVRSRSSNRRSYIESTTDDTGNKDDTKSSLTTPVETPSDANGYQSWRGRRDPNRKAFMAKLRKAMAEA